MFKIVNDNGVFYCTDVKKEIIRMLNKRYTLEYSLMTLDDIITFAIESDTIISIEPSKELRPKQLKQSEKYQELMYDMDPYFTCQRMFNM